MQMVHGNEKTGEPRSLKKVDFAKLIGVSPGRVSHMIRDGLPVEPDGRIDVARGKLWIQANVDPKRSAAQSAQGEMPFAAAPDASAERVRLLREQADYAALKNAEKRRELVPASEVEKIWEGEWRQLRSAILAAPSRLRQISPHLSAADVAEIDAELRRILEEFGNGQ